MNPSDGSDGVVGTLARQTCPLPWSSSVLSVKVPPISTATARSAERIDIPVAMECLHRRTFPTQRPCGVLVDSAVPQHDPIVALRRRGRDEPVCDVLRNLPGLTVVWMAVT